MPLPVTEVASAIVRELEEAESETLTPETLKLAKEALIDYRADVLARKEKTLPEMQAAVICLRLGRESAKPKEKKKKESKPGVSANELLGGLE